VIPTLKNYSDIVSDIPSGSIYWIFILTLSLTFYLTFFLELAVEVRQCPLRSGARCWEEERGGGRMRKEGVRWMVAKSCTTKRMVETL